MVFCVPIYVVFCVMWFVRNGSVFPHFRFWLLIQFLFSLQNLVALLLTARDVQMRPSPHFGAKVHLASANLSYLWNRVGVYLWKYAFRPRPGT